VEPTSREELERMVACNSLKIIDEKALTLPPEAEEESEPAATAYLRLPPALKSRIEAAAAGDKLSLNAWAIRCFESCCDRDKSVKVANQVAKVNLDLTRR
jgi:predicted HicB family RNase H-like nuclease